MFANLREIIIKHIGLVIATVIVIISIYLVYTQVILKTGGFTEGVSELTTDLDKNTLKMYDNKIITGSQALGIITKYYSNNDAVILLFNNPSDYNNMAYRFWITGKSCKYGENKNYENKIISNNYNNISVMFAKEGTFKTILKKESLESYKDSNSKNYINLTKKYKAVLIKCNDVEVGVTLLAI